MKGKNAENVASESVVDMVILAKKDENLLNIGGSISTCKVPSIWLTTRLTDADESSKIALIETPDSGTPLMASNFKTGTFLIERRAAPLQAIPDTHVL